MKRIRVGGAIVALVLGMAIDVHAQSSVGVFRPPAEGRKATHSSPPTQQQVSDSRYPVYPIGYTLLPAIVMSDGSVYANFGYGYEQVSRACGQGRVLDGRGMKTPLRNPQPVPAPVTPSAENLPSVQAQRRAASRVAHSACYARDIYGRLVVVR